MTPVTSINLIKEIGALKYVLPELEKTIGMKQTRHHFGDVYEHTMETMRNLVKCKGSDYLPLRVAAILHDIGKIATQSIDENGNVHFLMHDLVGSDMAEDILRRMKYSNEIIKEVKFYIKNHMRTKQWGDDCSHMKDKTLRKLQYECKNKTTFDRLLLLIHSDNMSHAADYCLPNQTRIINERVEQMEREGDSMFGYRLPVTGNDIMEFKGIEPGSEVKKYLDYLLKVAFTKPKITKEECLKLIKNY